MPKSSGKPGFFAIFTTAWGPMGVAGGDRGLRGLVLPHYQPKDLADLLQWDFPGATRDDERFESLRSLCRDFFNGREVDFSDVACELPPEDKFAGKMLRACRGIPYGRTQSYRELALSINRPDAAQAVAAALGKNPIPLVVPCHRVIYSDGRTGGFSAAGGVEIKKRMLALEQR